MTIAPIRSNLHEEPNSFIGRASELTKLSQFVLGARAATLCGTGGIGKTRLALRLLAGLAGDFPDGAWFVELGDVRQPDLVVCRVAAVLGVEEESGRPLIETLAEALRPRRVLLALDNCEHLIDACAQLCQRLLARSAGLRIIVTSREPLRVAAETVWQVQPLALPPPGLAPDPDTVGGYAAVQLFTDRALAAQPGFALGPANAGSIAAICRTLDGVPLAIELAAAWTRALSADQIAARLTDRFSLLTSGDRTAPARQRTLRAAIDWSHDLLSAPEQTLLRRLSVFAGWSLEMAEEVCAGDGLVASQILGLTASLVDKSLVTLEPEELGQTRYRLLDTIKDYAARRLAEAGETAPTRARLRDYTVRVAEQNAAIGMAVIPAPWSARVDVFRRWDIDAANALSVLNECLAEGDTETGLRICTAIRPCWIARGSFAEGGERYDLFLPAAAAVPAAVRGPALIGRAQLAMSSDPGAARGWAARGIELCRSAGRQAWVASGLNLLAEIALHTGQAAAADELAFEALAEARAAGDRWGEAYALGTRAAAVAHRGNLGAAEQLGEASIAVMQDIDQQWGAARTMLGLGELSRLRSDLGRAEQRYLGALPILREIDSRPETARCLTGLGRIAMDTGDLARARGYLAESLRLSHATGARIGVARGLEVFAALCVLEGRPGVALELIAAAAALREAAQLPGLRGARTDRFFTAAAGLGEPAIQAHWARGAALTSAAAVELALSEPALSEPSLAEPSTAGNGQPGLRAGTGRTAGNGRGRTPAGLSAGTPPARLTAREREIAALVAAGHSNKGIAETLYISPATAARHVANILEKLSFNTRSQIAAWAAANPPPPSGLEG
jgi:predicted ATPase/DNA-binding CsgD family transcriptional regulator